MNRPNSPGVEGMSAGVIVFLGALLAVACGLVGLIQWGLDRAGSFKQQVMRI